MSTPFSRLRQRTPSAKEEGYSRYATAARQQYRQQYGEEPSASFVGYGRGRRNRHRRRIKTLPGDAEAAQERHRLGRIQDEFETERKNPTFSGLRSLYNDRLKAAGMQTHDYADDSADLERAVKNEKGYVHTPGLDAMKRERAALQDMKQEASKARQQRIDSAFKSNNWK